MHYYNTKVFERWKQLNFSNISTNRNTVITPFHRALALPFATFAALMAVSTMRWRHLKAIA